MVYRINMKNENVFYTYDNVTGVVQLHINPVPYDYVMDNLPVNLHKLVLLHSLALYNNTYSSVFVCAYDCCGLLLHLKVCSKNGVSSFVVVNTDIDVAMKLTSKGKLIGMKYDTLTIELDIPNIMFQYILMLSYNRDFDGILQALDGVFGSNLCDYIKPIYKKVTNNSVRLWYFGEDKFWDKSVN